MKKAIFTSLFMMTLLSLAYHHFNKPTIESDLKTSENIRVIAHFDESLIAGNTIITPIGSIHSERIRSLLEQFKAKELQAIYRNRYNEKGLLKPILNKGAYQTDFVGWQEVILSDKSQASELVNHLKKENGVLNAYIEKPILFKPCSVPNDPEYISQWHLNSISNPNADIRAEQAWNINRGCDNCSL